MIYKQRINITTKELERLRLWHKEVALRRKRVLELERKSKEAEEMEERMAQQRLAEEKEAKLTQKQQMLEFRRLKRAEVCWIIYVVLILWFVVNIVL